MFFSPTARGILQLSWPIATALLGDTLLGIVDTKLVAQLGPSALGGVGIGVILMWLFYMVVLGFMRGVKTCIAFALGRESQADGIRYAQVGIIVGAAVGVVVWICAGSILSLLQPLGIHSSLIPYAQDFFKARSYGAPATFALAALVEHRQASMDSRTPMFIGIAGNILNAFLAYGLIYGKWGFPVLGVAGAGYGTAIAEWFEFLVMLGLFWVWGVGRRQDRGGSRIGMECPVTGSVQCLRISWSQATYEVFSLGIPTAISFGFEMLGFAVFTTFVAGINSIEIAAHQIALTITRVSFLPGIAVGEAASVLVSRALGAGKPHDVRGVIHHSLAIAVAFMAFCGMCFFFFGKFFARFFTADDQVIRVVSQLLIIAAIYQVFDAMTIVWRGGLRGAKDVYVTTVLGILMIWLFLPTAGFFLAQKAHLGAVGAWYGFLAKTSISALLFGWRWYSKGESYV